MLALSLAPAARAALRGRRPRVDRVAFRFRLSAGASARVTLARRVMRRGRWEWLPLRADGIAFRAGAGAGRGHLRAGGSPARGRQRSRAPARRSLARGRYRLTLSLDGGGSRSVVFSVG